MRYGQVSGDIRSFGTARRAQARACLSTEARVTVVLMTFRVLAQGGGGVGSLFWALPCLSTWTPLTVVFPTALLGSLFWALPCLSTRTPLTVVFPTALLGSLFWALPCLSTWTPLTVVFLTFSVLVQGGGGVLLPRMLTCVALSFSRTYFVAICACSSKRCRLSQSVTRLDHAHSSYVPRLRPMLYGSRCIVIGTSISSCSTLHGDQWMSQFSPILLQPQQSEIHSLTSYS